jgi:hypothetical protein
MTHSRYARGGKGNEEEIKPTGARTTAATSPAIQLFQINCSFHRAPTFERNVSYPVVTGKHLSLNLTAFDRKIRLALQIPLASSEKIGYNRSVEEGTHPQ